MSDLQEIPGIGTALSRGLNLIGVRQVKDLKGKNPQELYDSLCRKRNARLDLCVLYAFRCAVYYASGGREKEKLLWWNWTNDKMKP